MYAVSAYPICAQITVNFLIKFNISVDNFKFEYIIKTEIFRAGCNSPPAVTAREPFWLIRCNS